MRTAVSVITIFILFFASCIHKTDPYAPQVVTALDLDQIEKSVRKEVVPMKVIYYNQWFESNPALKEQFIPSIADISGNAKKSIFALDYKNCRLVELNDDGKYVRSIGGPGSGPGDFMYPQQNIYTSKQYMYIADNYGLRLQLFDLSGNYIRSVCNASVEGGLFSIGKDGIIISVPTAMDTTLMMYKMLIQDSLGNDLRKIGRISKNDNIIFKQNKGQFYEREIYYIIADEHTNNIWCVFWFYPIIQRYNYSGEFLEEIQLNSKSIKNELTDSKSYREQYKARIGGTHLLRKPQIMRNGELLINVVGHGNIQIFQNAQKSSIHVKYEIPAMFENELKSVIKTDGLLLKKINDKFYAFERELILKETDSNR